MAKRRKRNPSAVTWILISTAVVATGAALAIAVIPRVRARAPGYVPGREPKIPLPTEYVGAPGFAWAHADIFPELASFGDALERFGYESGDWLEDSWSILGSQMQDAVRAFQDDYNVVRQTIDQPPTPKLAVSGRIDADTVEAIRYVANLIEITAIPWPNIVYETRSAGVA
jgi:hypothetical protein